MEGKNDQAWATKWLQKRQRKNQTEPRIWGNKGPQSTRRIKDKRQRSPNQKRPLKPASRALFEKTAK